jgi:RNA polymerase sigma-70 factor (ECF subfamily)
MARLPDADREVVELRHHAGLTFAQMADMLSEPLGTLLARHHRALKKLKSILAGQGVDELSPDHQSNEYDDDGEGPDAMKRGFR